MVSCPYSVSLFIPPCPLFLRLAKKKLRGPRLAGNHHSQHSSSISNCNSQGQYNRKQTPRGSSSPRLHRRGWARRARQNRPRVRMRARHRRGKPRVWRRGNRGPRVAVSPGRLGYHACTLDHHARDLDRWLRGHRLAVHRGAVGLRRRRRGRRRIARGRPCPRARSSRRPLLNHNRLARLRAVRLHRPRGAWGRHVRRADDGDA